MPVPSLDAYYNFIKRQEAETPDAEYRWTIRGGLTVRVPSASPGDAAAAPSPTIAPFSEAALHDAADITDDTHFSLVPERIAVTPLPVHKNGKSAQAVLPLLDAEPVVPRNGTAEWRRLPKHLKELSLYIPPATSADDARHALLDRLLDPTLTLDETAKLLGVCTATVRRYANNNKLVHQRTPGNQRRFRLSEVAAFLHRQNGVVEDDE